MALPTLVDQTVSTWGRSAADITASFAKPTTLVVALPAPSLSTVTCNLSTDTLIYRADGGLWDDTNQAWIPIDKVSLRGDASTTPGAF
jgi:hypothetical protein